jgi:Skp family chaperone for outer membrane proteins
MNKKILLFFVAFFFTLNPIHVMANTTLAYLNVELLIKNSKAIQVMNKELNKINDNNQKIFITEEKKITNERENLIKKKNVINANEFKKEVQELEKKIKVYNDFKNKTLKEFNAKKSIADDNFTVSLSKILENYKKKNSIDLIINKQSILLGSQNFDITDDIILIFNNEIKKISF